MNQTLTHMINPILAPSGSRLAKIQSLTFTTIQNALCYSQTGMQVDVLAIQFPEDHPIIPPFARRGPDLTRSVLDLSEFDSPRRLPLLHDLLNAASQATSADFIVYTNIDIHIQPYFYAFIANQVQNGKRSFVINRRTLPNQTISVDNLAELYAQHGEPHRGWDCFVFPRAWIPNFRLENVCIGAPMAGLALVANLVALSGQFVEFRREQLTFHLGNDRTWAGPSAQAYIRYNILQTQRVLDRLVDKHGGFPRGTPPARMVRLFHLGKLGTLYLYLRHRFYIPVGWIKPD
jgi:hypothetical protein